MSVTLGNDRIELVLVSKTISFVFVTPKRLQRSIQSFNLLYVFLILLAFFRFASFPFISLTRVLSRLR